MLLISKLVFQFLKYSCNISQVHLRLNPKNFVAKDFSTESDTIFYAF